MEKQVFVINGSGTVGKDTFVKSIREILNNKSRHLPTVINHSSISIVEEMARIAGWDGGKSEKDRKFLSDLKDLASAYNDTPFKDLQKTVEYFFSDRSHAKLCFLHIREPEEIDRAIKEFNAKTILVKRNSVPHIVSNRADANVYNHKYDFVIENNGSIDDLKKIAKDFLKLNGYEVD